MIRKFAIEIGLFSMIIEAKRRRRSASLCSATSRASESAVDWIARVCDLQTRSSPRRDEHDEKAQYCADDAHHQGPTGGPTGSVRVQRRRPGRTERPRRAEEHKAEHDAQARKRLPLASNASWRRYKRGGRAKRTISW